MKLDVKYMPIESIKPYKNNAKIHTEEQIEQIKNSIVEFGMNDPIGIWGKDNIIVEGHGRLDACKQLGFTEVPVIRLDGLTDDQRKAYTLVHNKLTMNTDFNIVLLNLELDDIADIDMGAFGFELDELSPDDFGEDFTLPDGDKAEMCQITFYLHERQKELIEYAMQTVEDEIQETFGNKNKHGNEIYEVVRQWAEQRK